MVIHSRIIEYVNRFTDHPIFNFWVPEEVLRDRGGFALVRARMLLAFIYLLSLFAVPYLFYFAFVDYDWVSLVWTATGCFPLILAPVLLRRSESVDATCHLVCAVSLIATAGNALTETGVVQTGLPWLILAPAYAAIFLDLRSTLLWTLLAVVAAVGLHLGMERTAPGELHLAAFRRKYLLSVVGFLVFTAALFTVQEVLSGAILEKLESAREKLRKQALYDDLTGLPNRDLFEDRLVQAVRRARRLDAPLLTAFVDLDDFKAVNDNLGHAAGDQLLRTVGCRLSEVVRDEDTVARVGGDEFVFVFERANPDEAIEVISERLSSCLDRPVELEGREVHAGASIGFAVFEPDELSDLEDVQVADLLQKSADRAMYEAKESKTTDWELSSIEAGLLEDSENRFDIEESIRRGLEEREFVPYYHAIFDAANRDLLGAEVLVRWRHPERGVLTPAAFMAVAEKASLMEDVQRQMCEKIVEDFRERRAPESGTPLDLLINLSPKQLEHPVALRELQADIESDDCGALELSFEVTETGLIEKTESVRRLRKAGFRLVVDDFGTGFSSLDRFRKIEVDALKIDMNFIQNYDSDIDRAIIENIADLGRRLGVEVIGEGVESEDQLAFLADLEGCGAAQGFFFARPEPFERFAERVNDCTEDRRRLFA